MAQPGLLASDQSLLAINGRSSALFVKLTQKAMEIRQHMVQEEAQQSQERWKIPV